jgi:hypothetical protein
VAWNIRTSIVSKDSDSLRLVSRTPRVTDV